MGGADARCMQAVDIKEALGYILKYGFLAHRMNTILEEALAVLDRTYVVLPHVDAGLAGKRKRARFDVEADRRLDMPEYVGFLINPDIAARRGRRLRGITVRQLPESRRVYREPYGVVELSFGERSPVTAAWLESRIPSYDILELSLINRREWGRILSAASGVRPLHDILSYLHGYVELAWDVIRGAPQVKTYDRGILEQAPEPSREMVEYLRASMDIIEMLGKADRRYVANAADVIKDICKKTFLLFPMRRDYAEIIYKERAVKRDVRVPGSLLGGSGMHEKTKTLAKIALNMTSIDLYFGGDSAVRDLRIRLVNHSETNLCRLLLSSFALTSEDWEWIIDTTLRHLNLAVLANDAARRLCAALSLVS
jgi:hypothetical protein